MARRRSLGALVGMCLLGPGAMASAQPVRPELLQATSVDAVLAMLGASKAEPSTRLALKFPDIVLPGPLELKASSAIPGTVAMILMAGAPAGWHGKAIPGLAPPSVSAPPAGPRPVVVKAWQVPPGEEPSMSVRYPAVERRQTFTLLVSARGQWHIVVREVKVACRPPSCGGDATRR